MVKENLAEERNWVDGLLAEGLFERSCNHQRDLLLLYISHVFVLLAQKSVEATLNRLGGAVTLLHFSI